MLPLRARRGEPFKSQPFLSASEKIAHDRCLTYRAAIELAATQATAEVLCLCPLLVSTACTS